METYRLFIAAELPPEVKATLVGIQQQLKGAGAPVKWVAPRAMHLTLRFLGETDAARVPEIGATMRDSLAAHAPIRLRLTAAGAFPNARRPSVVWAGVGGATAELERAQADLETALVAALGVARESRPFRAHLTLGRVRREAGSAEQERLSAAIRALPPPAPLEWDVDRIVLFRSDLRREGPAYTEITDCRL